MNKLALSILAVRLPVPRLHRRATGRCSCRCGTTPATRAARTPTTSTSSAEVDDAGVYEISGFRGTTRFVEITQQQQDMMSMDVFKRPRATRPAQATDDSRPRRADHRRRRLVPRGPQRRAPRRPHAATGGSSTRASSGCSCGSAACDWINEVDARVAINRLDDPGADMTPEEIARRFSDMPRVDRGDDPLRHGPRALLPRAPRHQRAAAVTVDRQQGGGLATSRPTTTASTRSTTTRRSIVEFPVPDRVPLLADPRRRRSLLAPSTG